MLTPSRNAVHAGSDPVFCYPTGEPRVLFSDAEGEVSITGSSVDGQVREGEPCSRRQATE